MKKLSDRRIKGMSQLEKDAFVAYQSGMSYGQFKGRHPAPVTDKEVKAAMML